MINKAAKLQKIKKINWIKIFILIIITFLLMIIFAVIYPVGEIEADQSLDEYINHLNSRIPVMMEDYDIPGLNISLIKAGKLIWTRAYGYADLEKNEKMTIDTYCRVESISKSVTAWGVMKLVENGRLDLDKSVGKYIRGWKFPASKFNEQEVTARSLLSHSAGLQLGTIGSEALYNPENDNIPSLRDSLTKEVYLFQEPNKSFYYSDTGYNLLELLVEEVSGQDFSDYMEEEILLPLKLSNSSYSWSEEWNPAVATGYDIDGNPVPVYTYSMKASGNLYSKIEDIAKFVTAGMSSSFSNKELIKADTIKKMYEPVVEDIPSYYGIVFDSYGFGHYIEWLSNGEKSVSHGGQGTGWMSHFQSIPETGDGIVLLTNSQRSWPAFAYILSDWTDWSGFSSVGMEIIITGQKILWSITALIIFIFLWSFSSIIEELITGRRKFAPGKEMSKVLILTNLAAFIIINSAVLFAINMDYQPLYSIFPIASNWLFYSLLSLGTIFLVKILFPRYK